MKLNICGRTIYYPEWFAPSKILMRLCLALSLTVTTLVSAQAQTQKVTLSEKNVSLSQVFNKIKQQTGYTFFFNNKTIRQQPAVTIAIKDATIQQAMDMLLENRPFTYAIVEKTIVIRDKPVVQSEAPKPAVDQPKTISVFGSVNDEDGNPLPGATVKIKGTKQVTTTSVGGQFILHNVAETDVLQFSFIGYQMQELSYQKGVYKVNLQLAQSKLDEVQVIAYGQTTNRLSTGSVTTITSKDLEKSPAPNVLEALEGAVPGLSITKSTTTASGMFTIQLRGVNSLPGASTGQSVSAINTPLVMIDGFPLAVGTGDLQGRGLNQSNVSPSSGGQSPLYGINPEDIESVSILKDADATAIYGSRGANGVILITTKKGKPHKLTADGSVLYGLSAQANKLDLLNTDQYLQMRRDAFTDDGRNTAPGLNKPTPTVTNAYDLLVWNPTDYTDWQKMLIGAKPTLTANVSLSGGTQGTTYRINGSYFDNSNAIKGLPQSTADDFDEKRETVAFSSSSQSANNRLQFNTAVNLSMHQNNLPFGSLESLIWLAPNAPALFDDQGNINWAPWRIAGGIPSQLSSIMRPYTENTTTANVNAALNYHITKEWQVTGSAAYSLAYNDGTSVQRSGINTDPLTTFTRETEFNNTRLKTLDLEANTTYNKTIGNHNFNVLAGLSYTDNQQSFMDIDATGYLSDGLQMAVSGASAWTADGYAQESRLLSFYARAGYNYASKYIINISGRRDGSSAFGEGNKFGNFGSVAGAWIFSSEKWMEALKNTIPFFSFGKFRGSYGIIGSPVGTPYTYLSSLTTPSTAANYQGSSTLTVTRPPNPDVKWAETKKLNYAVDLGFFNDRLLLSGEGYRNRTGNQIVTSPLSAVSGFTQLIFNLPAVVQNSGIEGTITYRAAPSNKFTYSVSANIGINRNKLVSFPNIEKSNYATLYTVGQPILRSTITHADSLNTKTGQYVTESALRSISVVPDFIGGSQWEVSYKGFNLALNWTYAKQKGMMGLFGPTGPGILVGGVGNEPVSVLNRWMNPGDKTLIPGATLLSNSGIISDAFYGNASYVYLKTARLLYTFPVKWLSRVKIKSLSVFASADNLWMISGYKGTNPETPSSIQNIMRRTIQTGMNISL